MDPFSIDSISQMTNAELQKALEKYQESVETITSENRSFFENKLRTHSEKEKDQLQNSSYLSNSNNKPEPVIQPKVIKADTYYGVFIPSHLLPENEDIKKVYTDKSECLTLLKRYQGSRFKGFPTYDEALCFSEYGPIVATVPNSEKPDKDVAAPLNQEKPSPFRGPKSQELVKFRKAIEKGNHDYFDECVSSNPRFLVSSGDTPSILQEGSRYNALHIACRNDQPEFCKKILITITSPEFFQRLYPDDSSEISERRRDFLLDLYLNTPDKGFNETPLHFACKHGSIECVKYLLSYPACDKGLLNKYGQTPIDVICSRTKKPDKSLSQNIKDMFEDLFFVPVLRDRDNCLAPHIGPPWSPVAKKGELHSSFNQESSPNSPLSPLFKVKGYAGPMSPQKADDFYSRWKRSAAPSPSRSAKAKVAALRIADHEKGLERIGRDLASEFNVGWVEYWDFLGQFMNIASMEGLQKLEQHLRNKYKEVIENRNREETNQTLTLLRNKNLSEDSLSSGDLLMQGSPTQIHSKDESLENADVTKSSLSTMGELCQDLEALRLNASLSPNLETENVPRVRKVLPLKRKHSSTPFAYSFKKKVYEHSSTSPSSSPTLNNLNIDDRHDCSEREHCNSSTHSDADYLDESLFSSSSAQLYNFAVQSTRISSLRLSSILNEISSSISQHIGPDFRIVRILRNKMKPEIQSLRKVLGKCLLTNTSPETSTPPDFRFVHVFLAAKTVEHLMVNMSTSASVLFLATRTMELLTANLEALEESSSDDEDQVDIAFVSRRAEAGFLEEEERREERAHFRCVSHALEKALQIGLRLMKEGKDDEAKVDLGELDECQCAWHWPSSVAIGVSPSSLRCHPVDVQGINDSLNNNNSIKKKPKSRSRSFLRAPSFLHRLLFGKTTEEEEEEEEIVEGDTGGDLNQSKTEIFPVFKNSVVKQLSFEDDQEGKDKNGNGENNVEEDSESFTSAVSSLEDDQSMGTPEDLVDVYIYGTKPSKEDMDIFIAIDGLDIDETIYPYVNMWLRLMESHSRQTRERWPSTCCRYEHQSPFSSLGPVRTSSPLQDKFDNNSIRKNIFPQSPPP